MAPGKGSKRSLRHPPAVLRGLLRRGRPPVHELDMQSGARGDSFFPTHLKKRPLCAAPETALGRMPHRRTGVGRRPPTRVRRAVRARSCSKRVVRGAASGVETHARRAGGGESRRPGLRRARPKNPRREGQVPGGTLLQRAGQLLRGQRVPALRKLGNDGAYIAKGPKLGLGVGRRRGEIGAVVPRPLEHPAFRQDGVPDREGRAVIPNHVADGQQRLRPPLAVH